jgi:hypothetical protein
LNVICSTQYCFSPCIDPLMYDNLEPDETYT